MNLYTSVFLAAALCMTAPQAFGQSTALSEAARQETVVAQAMQRYEQGLMDLKSPPRQQ